MRCCSFVVVLACACLAAPVAHPERARAEIFIAIDKSAQRLTVAVDGRARHHWPISTGLGGGPPSGSYRPERMERMWYSRRYDWSPMPHSIFFYKGYAIHGTNYVSRLGNRASHGCVRLHPSHAATLFALVRNEGMRRTTVAVSDTSRFVARR